jgi:hypothetical protein
MSLTHDRGRWLSAALAAAMLLSLLAAAPGARAEPTWLPPEEMTPPSRSLTPMSLALAPDGTAHALLIDQVRGWPTRGVVATRRLPGGAWEPPTQLAPSRHLGRSSGQIGVDDAGNAVALFNVWKDGVDQIQAAYRPAGADWEPPQTLGTGRALALDVGAGGRAAAVWVEDHPGDPIGDGGWTQWTEVVRAARRSAGAGRSWTAAQTLSEPAALDSLYPRVAVDAAGQVVAVWARSDETGVTVQARQRPATGGWTSVDDVSDAGHISYSPDVGIDHAGDAHVVWTSRVGPDSTRIHAAHRPATGPWQRHPAPISRPEETADLALPTIAVGSRGEVVTIWTRFGGPGEADTVQGARRSPGGAWQPAVDIPPPAPPGRSYEEGLAVDPRGNATVTWIRRTRSAQDVLASRWPRDRVAPHDPATISPKGWWWTSGDTEMDAQGNAVVLITQMEDPRYLTSSVALDAAGPVTRTTRPRGPFSLTAPKVAWSASDVWSAVSTHRVRVATATSDGSFGSPQRWLGSTTATARTYTAGTLGSTYCFAARATDTVGNVGAYSRERCTALPFNDRALKTSDGWRRPDVAGAYRGTASRSSTAGATLRSPKVSTTRIALVATRAPGAGRVDVFLGTQKLATVDLGARTLARQQIIPVATFSEPRTGIVRIVNRSGDPVTIEGLGVSAR